jgi:predicted lipid-binding transport protein (Tim44 family)
MVYGDLQFFDLIIFAGVAVFLIYRLRSVLGKRSGFEKKNLVEDPAHKKTNNNSKPIPKLNDSEKKLSLIYKTLDDFDHRDFLENAKFAFETIINAFNSGDKKTLKNLLTKNVYQSFERAIEQEKNNPNFQFYSLVVDSVEETNIDKNIASITLKITSEQFKDNDENTITKKQDTWTFQKEINNKSPIWLLSST